MSVLRFIKTFVIASLITVVLVYYTVESPVLRQSSQYCFCLIIFMNKVVKHKVSKNYRKKIFSFLVTSLNSHKRYNGSTGGDPRHIYLH